jgi:hypothetical protein
MKASVGLPWHGLERLRGGQIGPLDVVHGEQDRVGGDQLLQPVQRRGRAQLADRRGHHAKPLPACFLAGPGQQQRFPRARSGSDEQHPALALLRAVQQAEDGLELRPAPRIGEPWSATASPKQVRRHTQLRVSTTLCRVRRGPEGGQTLLPARRIRPVR